MHAHIHTCTNMHAHILAYMRAYAHYSCVYIYLSHVSIFVSLGMYEEGYRPWVRFSFWGSHTAGLNTHTLYVCVCVAH
jgi:hypothetical protein